MTLCQILPVVEGLGKYKPDTRYSLNIEWEHTKLNGLNKGFSLKLPDHKRCLKKAWEYSNQNTYKQKQSVNK